jgi:biotin carboxyl carrier protein
MGGQAKRNLILEDGRVVECICHRDGSYDITLEGETFHVQGTFAANGGPMQVIVNRTKRIQMTTVFREANDGRYEIRMWPVSSAESDYSWNVNILNPMLPSSLNAATEGAAGQGTIEAPMPGKVSRILVAEGGPVNAGDVLLVMEAMKMEHTIVAQTSGIVQSLNCRVNDIVQDGAVLAIVGVSTEEDSDLQVVV